MRLQGLTYGQICIVLNAKQIPKPMGRLQWQKSHVVRLLRTQYVRRIEEEVRATGSGPGSRSPESSDRGV
jgi:hypothetical protein